mgnify:CR=1 FL=1
MCTVIYYLWGGGEVRPFDASIVRSSAFWGGADRAALPPFNNMARTWQAHGKHVTRAW